MKKKCDLSSHSTAANQPQAKAAANAAAAEPQEIEDDAGVGQDLIQAERGELERCEPRRKMAKGYQGKAARRPKAAKPAPGGNLSPRRRPAGCLTAGSVLKSLAPAIICATAGLEPEHLDCNKLTLRVTDGGIMAEANGGSVSVNCPLHGLTVKGLKGTGTLTVNEIGRASCRERV